MKYKIVPDKYSSREMFNLAHGENKQYLEHFIGIFNRIIKEKALDVCTDTLGEPDKAFDRGYVKGLNEALEFIVESYKKGERLHYGKPDHVQTKPKIF